MSSKKTLTFMQFLIINSQLAGISDTWADLWVLIFHTSLSAGRLLALRYDDIDNDSILIRERRLKALRVEIPPTAMAMITRRRERYPEDIFVFQSHSNRVKNECRPVTFIAFNTALNRAAKSLPGVTVSSSSARNVSH
jgi:integrase